MEVPCGSTDSDVAPVISWFNLPQIDKEVDDRALKLITVHSVVTLDEGATKLLMEYFINS